MSHTSRSPRSSKPSIKYNCCPLESHSLGHSKIDDKVHTPPSSDPSRKKCQNSEAKSSEILSTAGLISAVGHIWDSASCPLAFLQPKKGLRHKDAYLLEESVLFGKSSSTAESQFVLPADLLTGGHSPELVRSDFELLGVSKKISFFEPRGENHRNSLLGRLVQRSFGTPMESGKANIFASVEISYHLRTIYGWMIDVTKPGPEQQLNTVLIENKKISESCLTEGSIPTKSCALGDSASNHTNGSTCFHAEINNSTDSSLVRSKQATEDPSITSLSSDYLLEDSLERTNVPDSISSITSSILETDYYLKHLASDVDSNKASPHRGEDDHFSASSTNKPSELLMEDNFQAEAHSPIQNKQQFGLAKQQHAFSGALAGISVSLCLHPVDTMKTVIQSCHADQRSINHICRSIISDRGISGLYRGITSNIASSAPISAVYTFTYESVKGALLPLLPKEYQSFAHCLGGGCASVATSFIFTPSERIKQQMQVGFHYQNCWSALVGIIKKGGLTSLYAGWGAVLCRNVPHSIIKFYTYESLKQLTSQLQGRNAQSSTIQTLICGGLAGSTAALFTTPFDVVKTRLQTQIPGSIHRYDGVFRTLVEIGRHEGLKGLYRGLVPRLVMYVSQGAIFFAAYESFKRIFSMDISPKKLIK